MGARLLYNVFFFACLRPQHKQNQATRTQSPPYRSKSITESPMGKFSAERALSCLPTQFSHLFSTSFLTCQMMMPIKKKARARQYAARVATFLLYTSAVDLLDDRRKRYRGEHCSAR